MFRYLIRNLIEEPIRLLYLNLPYLGWDGLIPSEICYQITGVNQHHCDHIGYYECDSIIEGKISSKLTAIKCILWLSLVTNATKDTYVYLRYIMRRIVLDHENKLLRC